MRFVLFITFLISSNVSYAKDNTVKYKAALSTVQRAVIKQSGLDTYAYQSLKALEGKAKREAKKHNVAFIASPIVFIGTAAYRKKVEMHYKDFTLESKKESSKLVFEVQF